jgi:hypothetical protein
MGDNERDGASRRDLKRTREHVVFDFTGLGRPEVRDIALILTARLRSGPRGYVWARSLPAETARILGALRLEHLFRPYPKDSDRMH